MKKRKTIAILLTGLFTAALLGGCAGKPQASETSLGEFTTQDINGNTCTQEIFEDYDLTLVNIFATWCTPCVQEMPELEKVRAEMAGKGVNVIGILLDARDEDGEAVPEELEKARLLVERTGVQYPVLLPDEGYMNGRLEGIQSIPETFFVDKDGNVVGETYVGSGDYDDWMETIQKELDALKEAA